MGGSKKQEEVEGNGSLRAPLLGDYAEVKDHGSGTDQQYEVVVAVSEDPVENFDRTPDQSQQNLNSRASSVADEGDEHKEETNLDNPVLAFQSRNTFRQIHDQHGPHSRDYTRKGVLESNLELKSGARRIRNPNKSFVARAAQNAKNDPRTFLYNLLTGLYMFPFWSWDAMKANKSLTVLSAKQGVVAGLASILCVVKFPKPYTELSSIALWAVVTTDLLYEGNIGLSISKGFNRVLGTLAAGLLGFGLNQVGPLLGEGYPYFVVICVIAGGGIFRFLKGIPPLKDQWGYAFTVATIAFHLFIVTAYIDPERWTLPMLRFSMILFGFTIATVVNIAIQPIYAGDALHKLVAKNFETAAYVFKRCVEEYNKDTKLDHVPDILSGRSVDDKIHQSYHEIVMSDSDIDKLLSAVHWEPSHGRFFMGYPWHLYDDITDYLRYTLYDVIALDLCLRANIQAPKRLRDIFAEEMETIASECAIVLRKLGDSMKNMKKFASQDIMRRAEEAAVALQYKIHLHTHLLLGSGEPESPLYPGRMGSLSPFANKDQNSNNFLDQSNDFKNLGNGEVVGGNNITSPGGIGESFDDSVEQGSSSQKVFTRSRSRQNTLETLTEGLPAVNISIPNGGLLPRSQSNVDPSYLDREGRSAPNTPGGRVKRNLAWQETFLHRRSSLGHNWDGTLERISALSLVKFASLLIEVVSKMKYVVDCVELLSREANFEECDPA